MKAKSASKNIIKDLVIVAIGVLAIWIGLQAVFGTQNPFYVVSSGSMIPVLEVHDVLIVQGHVPFKDIKKGDIIVFDRPAGHDRVIVHRVAAIIDDDPKTIRTKGDANPASIPGTDFPITEDEYIGKVAHVIPQIGFVTRILSPPINYVIIAIIIGIMVFKQVAKKKNEKKLAFTDPLNKEETQKSSSLNPDDLQIQSDTEYTVDEPKKESKSNDVKTEDSSDPYREPDKK